MPNFFQRLKRAARQVERNNRHGWATTYPAVGIDYRNPRPTDKTRALVKAGFESPSQVTLALHGLTRNQVKSLLS